MPRSQMENLKIRKHFGEWIDYDKSDRRTWTPPYQEVEVMIRTPFKNPDGTPFFYCPKAMRVAPMRMRNLCIPEGRKGAYFDVCKVVRWRYV